MCVLNAISIILLNNNRFILRIIQYQITVYTIV